jgi:hypothetical protein
LSPPSTHIVLQLAGRLVEGLTDRVLNIRRKAVRLTINDDFIAGHGDVNVYAMRIALLPMAMRDVDNYATAEDMIVKLVQLRGMIFDHPSDFLGQRAVAETDLKRRSHDGASRGALVT